MERKLPGMAPHPSCPGCGRARPPPAPPWRGGGPGPPLTAPTPPAGAEQEAQETWFILQEMRPSVPAISPQPAPLPVTPGWHRGCGEAGGGSGGSRLPPNPPVPVAASCPGRGPGALGCCVGGHGPGPSPGPSAGPGGAPLLEEPMSLLEPGACSGAARSHPRRYLDPWRGPVPVPVRRCSGAGARRGRPGQGSPAGAAPGDVAAAAAAAEGRVRGGARRGCPAPKASGHGGGSPAGAAQGGARCRPAPRQPVPGAGLGTGTGTVGRTEQRGPG